jgi:rhodanese-related sulfurtransferase
MPGFGQISPAQCFRLLGTPEAPLILDVRLPEDRAADPRVIPTALALAHDRLDLLPPLPPGRQVITVCAKGRKLSEGAAAVLRTRGLAAEGLEGGHVAWAEAGLPLVPLAALPAAPLWVTRHRPKIDRIACPWLIRRFIDPSARFLFVAPAEVQAVAERFGATPFDIEGVPYSHRGALCTFDTMLSEWGLQTEALLRLATVVRAADTDRHDLSPQAAGLLAISVGLSRQFRDDLAQLEAGMVVYDALYRWARDGYDEGHDWPAPRTP